MIKPNTDDVISVCCFKWGDVYSADYVNILYDNVRLHLPYEFEFYCFTDDAHGIDERVHILASSFLDEPPLERYGQAWPKIGIHEKGKLPADRITLFLDLDIVILGSLAPLVDVVKEQGGFHMFRHHLSPIKEALLPLRWRYSRGGNSSVLSFIPREQYHIYEEFKKLIADSDRLNSAGHKWLNDQAFQTLHAANLHYHKEGLIKSFKRDCMQFSFSGKRKRAIKPPADCCVVVFTPGFKLKPHYLVDPDVGAWGSKSRAGFGSVDWIQEHWRRGK